MKIAIIGSGGREHALVHQLSKSKKLTKIYTIPGNAGTGEISENIDLNVDNFKELYNFIAREQIELVVVGPEKPLVEGLVDFLESKKIKVFGPRKSVAQLEGSKIFTKKICSKYKIPTSNFKIFENINDAKKFLSSAKFPLVIKSDGLAAGKGVYICKNIEEGITATNEIFGGKFGVAKNLLVEDFLEGEEMSYFVICDGENYQFIGTAQDHKRVGEGDKGKNTGGMGCYSPSRLFNSQLAEKINSEIIHPTLTAIKDLGTTYRGFLYVGLMIKDNKPYLVEFNVRMGDPECQTILPLLEDDLIEIFVNCCLGKLKKKIRLSHKKSICIVLCSKGYPDEYKKNIPILGLDTVSLKEDEYIFHAGTKLENNEILASGGRVLNFVSVSENFYNSRKDIIKLIDKLNWKNGFFRKDIGYKVIDV